MTLRIYQLGAPHFTAGLEIKDGVVVKAAPIIAYMQKQRWSEARVLTYAKSKGWNVASLEPTEEVKVSLGNWLSDLIKKDEELK